MADLFDSIRIKPTPRLARKLDYAPPIPGKSKYNPVSPEVPAYSGRSNARTLNDPTPFRNGKRHTSHSD